MNNIPAPFHQGELQVQTLANETRIAQRNGAVISDTILPGAISFVGQQNMLVLTSLDKQGYPWTSVLVGNPGFISAPNPQALLLDTSNTFKYNSDPLWENIKTNPQVGILVIELATRRRLRVNGSIRVTDNNRFAITVEQSYPNCPKYIQRRSLKFTEATFNQPSLKPLLGSTLTVGQIQLIENADSLFVGSASLSNETHQHGVDSSYRGGYPGFVEVIDGARVRIPDYKGNSLFNTLGNIQAYGKAAITFVDFQQGRLLQLSGSAEILWNQADPRNKTSGTQRFWELSVEHWQETALPKQLTWEFYDYSPHNPRQEVAGASAIEKLTLKVHSIEARSERIKLFRLVAPDGGSLPAFDPGAHLPIEVVLGNTNVENPTTESCQYAERHYSLLSSSHDNRYYDIAVQHEPDGRGGSGYMHKQLQANMVITAKPPRNAFALTPTAKHTVLIAGGIGITPILSMLRHLAESKASFEIHYTARSQADLEFQEEVVSLAGDKAYLYYSNGENACRLNLQSMLQKHDPAPDSGTHVFVCGPVRMIEAVRDLGETFGWAADQIHFESFGAPASANDSQIAVTLKKSSQVITVKPSQTVLDALIDAKIPVPFDCKRGECGMCSSSVIAGEVDHRDVYLSKEERKGQMCVCVSRAKGKTLTLDL
ncbi:MAG: pyridoxamine 5'-phosphate oxidase family protein [Amphritea sp.]